MDEGCERSCGGGIERRSNLLSPAVRNLWKVERFLRYGNVRQRIKLSEMWQGRDLKVFEVWKYGRLGEFGRAGFWQAANMAAIYFTLFGSFVICRIEKKA